MKHIGVGLTDLPAEKDLFEIGNYISASLINSLLTSLEVEGKQVELCDMFKIGGLVN